jgi:hypothetical protein
MYCGKLCPTPTGANVASRRRRERLRNWLALLALLAIGIF